MQISIYKIARIGFMWAIVLFLAPAALWQRMPATHAMYVETFKEKWYNKTHIRKAFPIKQTKIGEWRLEFENGVLHK